MSEFREKALGIGVISGRTAVRVQDVRNERGQVVGKDVTDELNNTVHIRDNRQDVTIRPKAVAVKVGFNPETKD